MTKIFQWVLLNGATLIGVLQSIIKAIKELATGVVNLLSLFMTKEAAEVSVTSIRWALNKIDAVLESIKGYFLK
jgi:hypothetical protein